MRRGSGFEGVEADRVGVRAGGEHGVDEGEGFGAAAVAGLLEGGPGLGEVKGGEHAAIVAEFVGRQRDAADEGFVGGDGGGAAGIGRVEFEFQGVAAEKDSSESVIEYGVPVEMAGGEMEF